MTDQRESRNDFEEGVSQPAEMPSPQGQPVYTAPPMPTYVAVGPQKQASKGWIVGLSIVVALCLIMVVSIVSCTSIANSSMSMMGFSSQSSDDTSDSRPKVGIISIDGTIQYDGSSCSPGGLRTLLDRAEKRSDIKAVVLRVNSGGGVATAGEEMAHYVKEFSKPIVVSSASTNASAAYEISSQSDYIFTSKTTAIGAIGVAMEVTDLSGLYEKLGINIETITSTESKDSSYGNRPLTDEERAWYQDLVNQIDEDFVTVVAEGRDMEFSEVKALANGMTYTGFDAVENGLADEIGYLEDAVLKASKLAGYNESLTSSTLTLSQQSSLLALLDALSQSKADGSSSALLAEQLKEDAVVR